MSADEGDEPKIGNIGDKLAVQLSKLSIVQVLCTLLVLAVAVAVSVLAPNIVATFSQTRIPVLMELESERLGRMAAELKERLDVLTPRSFVANQTGVGMSLEALQFPRFPRYGETFLSISGGKFVRMAGTLDGKVSVDLSPVDLNLPKPSYGFFYVLTTFGELVTVSDKKALPESEKISARDVVKSFFQSGVDQNVRLLKRQDGDTLVGYRAVPGTNLVLFSEKPLVGLLAPLHEMLGMILLGTLFASLGVFVVSFFLFKLQLRPLAKVKVYAANLVSAGGQTNGNRPVLPVSSEFTVLVEGYAVLERRLRRADGLARTVVQYTRLLHDFQKTCDASDSSLNVLGLATSLAELTMNLLQPLQVHPVVVYFWNSQEPQSSDLIVYDCGSVGSIVSLSAARHSSDAQALNLLRRYQDRSEPVFDQVGVHIPIVFQGTLLGLISVQKYPNALHFEMVEPHLALAARLGSAWLAQHSQMVEDFCLEWNATLARLRSGFASEGARQEQAAPSNGGADPLDEFPDFGQGMEMDESTAVGA